MVAIVRNAQQFPINVVGSSRFGRYPKVSLEKTYNLFESDGWMLNFAGYHRAIDIIDTPGEGRGLFSSTRGNFMIAVVNANVYRINPNLSTILLGQLETFQGEVFIDENLNSQICIVDGRDAYIYNYDFPANLTKQSAGPLGTGDLIPNYVCYHNSYFLFGNGVKSAQGSRFYIYEFDTGVGNEFLIRLVGDAAVQTKPDYALAVKRLPGQANNVFAMGQTVGEIHTNVAGLPQQIYRRNSSVNVDYGCLSVSTIAASDKFICYLGVNESNQPVITVFSGQQATAISTDGIDYLLEQLKHPEKSTAMFYRQDGHLFYILTFYGEDEDLDEQNQGNFTIAYDFNTEKFYHLSDEHLNYHPARQMAYFNNKMYFVSLKNCALYEISTNFTVINENLLNTGVDDDPRLVHEMQRIRICETFRSPKSSPFVVNAFTFTLEMGNDNLLAFDECLILMITEDEDRIFTQDDIQVIPEDGDPNDCVQEYYRGRIDLSLSKDGGYTFSNTVSQYMRPLAYRRNILRWQRLGYYNEFTPKIRFWTAGRVVASGGVIDVVI